MDDPTASSAPEPTTRREAPEPPEPPSLLAPPELPEPPRIVARPTPLLPPGPPPPPFTPHWASPPTGPGWTRSSAPAPAWPPRATVRDTSPGAEVKRWLVVLAIGLVVLSAVGLTQLPRGTVAGLADLGPDGGCSRAEPWQCHRVTVPARRSAGADATATVDVLLAVHPAVRASDRAASSSWSTVARARAASRTRTGPRERSAPASPT